jgi:hypothetical protein
MLLSVNVGIVVLGQNEDLIAVAYHLVSSTAQSSLPHGSLSSLPLS